MIEFRNYKRAVKEFYEFLVSEFNMDLFKETENGNTFYDIEYKDEENIVSVSLENVESHLQVIIFKLENNQIPDYDDKNKTLHLTKLNHKILKNLSSEDFKKNNIHFQSMKVNNETERKLLKSAKDLRLCLHNLSLIGN